MNSSNKNNTSFGLINILDRHDHIINKGNVNYCSQIVRTCFKDYANVGYIDFYFPNDWLLPMARNAKFLRWFCEVTSTMFHKVTYVGLKTSGDIGITLQRFNEGVGYAAESDSNYINNKGDFVFSDKFRYFRMDVTGAVGKGLPYASFLLVRYLFCSHFHDVADNFICFAKPSCSYLKGVSNFEKLQLAHYGQFWQLWADRGFFTYTANPRKIITLKEFKEWLEKGNTVNGAFGRIVETPIEEINNLFKALTFDKIYERLK